jgi:hypothetical protein
MNDISLALARAWLAVAAYVSPRERDERGDVPGWVMITVMTAGLVVVITAVAQDQLTSMVTSALNKVK